MVCVLGADLQERHAVIRMNHVFGSVRITEQNAGMSFLNPETGRFGFFPGKDGMLANESCVLLG